MRVRTLKQLAKLINDLDNGYTATIESSYSSTDRPKPRGQRFRTHVGQGRRGLRLYVKDRRGKLRINHDNSETYRTTEEAVQKAIELCGEDLNADPDEVLQVGDEVTISDYGTSYGKIEKVTFRKGKRRHRVKSYDIKLSRSGNMLTFDSRRVTKW